MSWSRYFIVVMAALSFHAAKAQTEESAPQEPPFIQEENEFDNDAFSIEDEINSTEPEKKNETVDLNALPESEPVEPQLEPAVIPLAKPEEPVVPAQPKTPRVMRKSAKGGVEYIEHPQAAKGLISITRDGSYIYQTKESKKFTHTGAFRFGMMDPPKIVASDGTTFEAMYSSGQQPILMFDYEWQPFSKYGKLGVQAGFGVMMATGNGRFMSADPDIAAKTPKEEYTFAAFPVNLGVIYRLEWMSRQWLAPYVAGGGTYVGVVEFRDDGKSPSMVGTPGAYGAGGMLLNVTAANRDTAFTLRSEYGISNLWVSLDYRYLKTFNEDLDFSSSIFGAGIVVDY